MLRLCTLNMLKPNSIAVLSHVTCQLPCIAHKLCLMTCSGGDRLAPGQRRTRDVAKHKAKRAAAEVCAAGFKKPD